MLAPLSWMEKQDWVVGSCWSRFAAIAYRLSLCFGFLLLLMKLKRKKSKVKLDAFGAFSSCASPRSPSFCSLLTFALQELVKSFLGAKT